MSHPLRTDEDFFQKLFRPLMGKKITGFELEEVYGRFFPVIFVEGDADKGIDDHEVFIGADAEGNDGGWPQVLLGDGHPSRKDSLQRLKIIGEQS